jgi:ubiquinone/menaquinone biosynthesis C-methylase UbiE
MGYILLNPFRKLLENPEKLLRQLVWEGMTILEPGCGMGYFTLPLARMVGPQGKVVAAEIQDKMLSVLARRALKAGLLERIELRKIKKNELGVEDLSNQVDLAIAIHMVHEVPDQSVFFKAVWDTLKTGGKLYVLEPRGHISQHEFEKTIGTATGVGFRSESLSGKRRSRESLLIKES